MDAPNSTARAALQEHLESARRVRVAGAAGAQLLLRPLVEAEGLRPPGLERSLSPRTAIIETPDAPRPPAPPALIPWITIDDVQTSRNAALPGFLVGAAIGAAVAAPVAWLFSHPFERSRSNGSGAAIMVFGTGGCGFLGLVIGSNITRWKTVLPVNPVGGPEPE